MIGVDLLILIYRKDILGVINSGKLLVILWVMDVFISYEFLRYVNKRMRSVCTKNVVYFINNISM